MKLPYQLTQHYPDELAGAEEFSVHSGAVFSRRVASVVGDGDQRKVNTIVANISSGNSRVGVKYRSPEENVHLQARFGSQPYIMSRWNS